MSESARSADSLGGGARSDLETAFVEAIPNPDQRSSSAPDIALLGGRDLQDATKRLMRLKTACGCQEGAVGMFVGFTLGATILARHGVSGGVGVLCSVGLMTGVVLLGTGLGKALGLWVARVRWSMERQRLLTWAATGREAGDRHVVLR